MMILNVLHLLQFDLFISKSMRELLNLMNWKDLPVLLHHDWHLKGKERWQKKESSPFSVRKSIITEGN
jgi:hypothetical protein